MQTNANKTATGKATEIKLSPRLTRTGVKIGLEKLLATVNSSTKNNLSTLSSKFGITWNRAYDNTMPKDVASAPAHSYIVEGKTADGKKVFYDRFQFILFVGGHRDKIKNVMSMNKKKFEKLTAAA